MVPVVFELPMQFRYIPSVNCVRPCLYEPEVVHEGSMLVVLVDDGPLAFLGLGGQLFRHRVGYLPRVRELAAATCLRRALMIDGRRHAPALI